MKPATDQKIARQQKSALVRLLRFIGKGPAHSTPCEKGVEIRSRASQDVKTFPETLIHQALSQGLLGRTDDQLTPTTATSAFLKRAMIMDHDEVFQEQHRECELISTQVDGEWHTVRRNELSSPLQALTRLKDRDGQAYFSSEALEAGNRLASDFQRGNLSPRITASWEPRLSQRAKGQAGGAQDLTDSAMAARLRFSSAADAMGPELSGVAIDVCCFEKGLEVVERERQWPARSAKLMLRTALQSLARHYAPPEVMQGRKSHRWGAEDYRPGL